MAARLDGAEVGMLRGKEGFREDGKCATFLDYIVPAQRGSPATKMMRTLLWAAGAQERRFTNTFLFSPTVLRIPADSVVEVKGRATDFLPGREPAESVTHRISVVGLAKHAEAVR